MGDGGVQRVMVFPLERVEIADRGTSLHAAGRVERAALMQQRFDERGLAAPGMPDQGDGTDSIGAVAHGRPRPVVDVGPLLAKTDPCAIRGNRSFVATPAQLKRSRRPIFHARAKATYA